MKVLYSNMLPLGIQDNQETIDESIKQQIAKSDRVDIAVGYVSLASLEELDRLICENKIKQIVLVIGMCTILRVCLKRHIILPLGLIRSGRIWTLVKYALCAR